MEATMKQHSYFRSSGYMAESTIQTQSGKSFDVSSLPAFLRTLLVTDGTVTKSLEAWFWENVFIEPLSNRLDIVKRHIEGLCVESGDTVLRREVMLKGVESDMVFAVARSTVHLELLPDDVSKGLKRGEIGIGELLREKGIETYRDIYNINYDDRMQSDIDPLYAALPERSPVLSRSYRIRVYGKPAIIVSEFFPVEIFK